MFYGTMGNDGAVSLHFVVNHKENKIKNARSNPRCNNMQWSIQTRTERSFNVQLEDNIWTVLLTVRQLLLISSLLYLPYCTYLAIFYLLLFMFSFCVSPWLNTLSLVVNRQNEICCGKDILFVL